MRTVFRRRSPMTRGVLRLPQIVTGLAVSDHQSSGGHTFGMIHAQSTGHYTVLLGSGGSLDGLAGLLAYPTLDVGAQASDVVAITAVAETYPATTDAYRRWLYATPGEHSLADGEIGVRAHLAVTFAAATTDTRRHIEEMGVEVGRRLPTLIASLAGAGIPTTPLTAHQIAGVIAGSYREDTNDDIGFADAGPADTTHRVRGLFCHDNFVSTTWVVAPHVLDTPTIDAVLAPDTRTPRARTAVTWRATRIAEALPVDDPTHITFTPHLQRFGAAITVTEPHGRTPSLDPLRANLPLYARLGLRPGFDRHAELFAAGLGIGVLLPEHGAIADEPIRHRHRTA